MLNIKAITFDAGGTLISPWPSVGDIYAQVAREYGFDVQNSADLNAAFAAAWKSRRNFGYSIAEWEQIVIDTFQTAAGHKINGELFRLIYNKFEDPACWRVHPKLAALLPALKNRYKLGVISNWDSRLRPLLERLNLAPLFDAIIISCEAGAAKPSPAIFRAASAALETPPSQILHVGDSQREDIDGAQAAGFHPFLFVPDSFDVLPLS